MPETSRSDRKKWEPKAPRRYNSNFSFYVSAPYRKARALYKADNPYCEVCLKTRGVAIPMEVLEHIVPINFGGAKLDFDNWMSVCRRDADVKNALEGLYGCLISFSGQKGNYIPTNREDVYPILEAYHKEHGKDYSPDVDQP